MHCHWWLSSRAILTLNMTAYWAVVTIFHLCRLSRSRYHKELLLSAYLLDYESTRFQSVKAILYPDRRFPVFCGEMNTKNGFGAYTGWVQFRVDGGDISFSPDQTGSDRELSRAMRQLWRESCHSGTAIIDAKDYSAQLKAN